MFIVRSGGPRLASNFKAFLLVALFYLSSRELIAQTPPPTIEDNFLRMPVALVYDTPYRIDWQIIETDGLIDLLLHEYVQLDSADSSNAPSYFGEVLNVPALEVEGISFWGEFILESEQPVIFRLVAADANNPGFSGVQGKWRVIEEIPAARCGEETDIVVYELTIREVGNVLVVEAPGYGSSSDFSENTLSWSAITYPEDGGTRSVSMQLLFGDELDSLAGFSEWQWWGEDNQTCEGHSYVFGELLHN